MNRFETFAHHFSRYALARALVRPLWRFLYKNPKAKCEQARFNRSGPDVLLKAKDSLDRAGLFFWIDFGTLLGAVRERRLLGHDTDLDLGMFLKDYSPRVEAALEQAGFTKLYQYEVDGGCYGLEQTFQCQGILLDIFYYSERPGSVVCHSFKPEPPLGDVATIAKYGGLLVREFPFPPMQFTSLDFLGATFRIPNDCTAHLSAHYGSTFMTPNPRWSNLDAHNEITLPPMERIGVKRKFGEP